MTSRRRRELPGDQAATKEVPLFRLCLLRAMYLLLAFGLGSIIWPIVVEQVHEQPRMHGVAVVLFATISLLGVIGIRYPLQMLPLLLFELVWKAIWVVAVALRLQLAGDLDAAFLQTFYDCLLGIDLLPIVIPWRYVIANYVTKPGDRWR